MNHAFRSFGNRGPSLALVPVLGALMLASGCMASVEDALDTDDAVEMSDAIIGGSNTTPGVNKWMANIRLNVGGQWVHHCGGALIHAQWVLTAAHCLKDGSGNFYSNSQFQIKLGDWDQTVSESSEQTKSVIQAWIRDGYEWDPTVSPSNYDMALLKLNSAATLNSNVNTIPLATQAPPTSCPPSNPNCNNVIATGWGSTAYLNPIPPPSALSPAILQKATIKVWPHSTCNAAEVGAIRDVAGLPQLQSDELCVGSASGNPGPCKGDSGGPLIRAKSGGGYELVGISSWGPIYCTSYAVYSSVPAHLDWIQWVLNY